MTTRYLFTQLRARGISLGAISNELDIPKSTLGDWDQLLADEIARLRAIEWEAVEEARRSSVFRRSFFFIGSRRIP